MAENTKLNVVAVTGGIGCGKSAVCDIIKSLGFKVISSDENAKEIMLTDKAVKEKIISHFGKNIYFDDGKINKDLLSKIVFGNSPENENSLAVLNSIVHPAVIQKLIEDVELCEKKGEKIIFVESALTFEAQLEEGFDFIIVVDAKENIIFERLRNRSNLTEDEIRFRIKQQLPQELKKQHADFVIENNGSLEELKNAVQIIVNILSQLAK